MASERCAVMIAAGGTGGHVFPALAVAEKLREMQIPVHWIGTERGIEMRVVPEAGFVLHTVPVAGVRGKNIFAWLFAPFLVLKSMLQILDIVRRNRIAVVLGMGGYVSFATGLAAIVSRKPLLLHEQNAVAGSSNRLLARFSSHIFTGFNGVLSGHRQSQWVGNPLRQAFSVQRDRLRDTAGRVTLLVIGGSLGAQALNTAVPAAIALWYSGMRLSCELKVIHQTGRFEVDSVRSVYSENNIDAEVLPFIDDVYSAYASADLVVARAGALTVSEIAAVGVASILVPYPHAIDDHQTANARQLANANAAVLLPQEQLSAETLAQHFQRLLGDRNGLVAMADAAAKLAKHDAAEQVATTCAGFCYG